MRGEEVVRFGEGPLGFIIEWDKRGRVMVKGFTCDSQTGSIGQAETSGRVRIGDEVIAVNGTSVLSCWDFAYDVMAYRPVDITFVREEREENE